MTDRERKGHGMNGLRFNWGMPPLAAEPTVDAAVVIRWLRSLKDDPWYELHPVPLKTLARVAGMTRQQIFRMINGCDYSNGSRVDPSFAAQLIEPMRLIESGRLVFVVAQSRLPGHAPAYARFLTSPAKQPPPQLPLLALADYDWWARCRTCGGRRYAAVTIGSRAHAACWTCIPVKTYRTIGAEPAGPTPPPSEMEEAA